MSIDPAVLRRLERFISAELRSRKHPGSSVSIVVGDELVWARGFGFANVEEEVPASPETVYGCASVTKTVVTTGFLQLWEKGLFGLDDPVNDHLDMKIRTEFDTEPSIRNLLTHYSGMPTRVPPLLLRKEDALTLTEHIRDAARTVQPPGKSWAYCNTGYTIIGHLIELFTGSSYDEYLKRNVLGPLEMNSSDFEVTQSPQGLLAKGYKRAGGPENPRIPNEPYILGTYPQDPAGSLYSNVIDLAHFVIANLNGGVYKGKRILKEETVDEFHRLQAAPGESRSGMALTWFRNVHDSRVMLSHTGGLPDYANHVALYPELNIGVCWLSNMRDGSGWRPPAPTALRILAGEYPKVDSKTFQTVPENWEKIVGVYGDKIRKSRVSVQNGFLLLDEALYLERIDDSRYRVHGTRNDGYELTFEYDENGFAKQYDLGNDFFLRFVEEEPHIDESAELIGTWRGEYVDYTGFHTLELVITDASKATATDKEGKSIPLEGFKAESGRVTGGCMFRIPEEYARWGTVDEIQVSFYLVAVDGKLEGLIKTPVATLLLTLEKV